MINAVGDPQRILLLGGTSELGLAIVAEYLSHAPAEVVLACQPGDPETANAVHRVKADGARGALPAHRTAPEERVVDVHLRVGWRHQHLDPPGELAEAHRPRGPFSRAQRQREGRA